MNDKHEETRHAGTPTGGSPWIPLILGLLLVGEMMGCKASGPIRNSEPREVGKVAVTDFGGVLELTARGRKRDLEPKPSGTESRLRETIFEESLRLEADGYIYHPNLLEFTSGVLFGFLQQDLESNFTIPERSTSENGNISEFNLSTKIFKKKKYPFRAFARQYRTLEPRPFLSSIERSTSEYGLQWQYLSEKMPTTVQFRHSEVEYDYLDDEEGNRRRQNTPLRLETAYNFSDFNTLSLIYEHQSIKEKLFLVNVDYDVDDIRLTHRLGFGNKEQHHLTSELMRYNQRGTFDQDRSQLRESLRLKHSEALRSWYKLEIIDRNQGNPFDVQRIQEQSYFLSGTLQHRLYQSLVSQVGGFIQEQDFEDEADFHRHGLQANLNYRKDNSWGKIFANYGINLQKTDQSGQGQSIPIIDESHTFNDPDPVILSDPNGFPDSIVITSADGTQLFQPGLDYTVFSFGNRVEIHRVPTGGIANGDTVLIDYTINIAGEFSLDTINQNFGIRQKFKFGLSPYYRIAWQDQSLSPENTPATPEDITANIVGAEFERGPFSARAEYEDHDSTITPFKSTRLSGGYTHRFKFGTTASLNAGWSEASFSPPNKRDVTNRSIGGRFLHSFSGGPTIDGAIIYREEDDTFTGDDTGIDIDLGLNWMLRQTEVKITFELGRFETDFLQTDSSLIYVQVSRRF